MPILGTTLIQEVSHRDLENGMWQELEMISEILFQSWGFDTNREILWKNYPTRGLLVFMQPMTEHDEYLLRNGPICLEDWDLDEMMED